jgi:hypothetical protein
MLEGTFVNPNRLTDLAEAKYYRCRNLNQQSHICCLGPVVLQMLGPIAMKMVKIVNSGGACCWLEGVIAVQNQTTSKRLLLLLNMKIDKVYSYRIVKEGERERS